MRVYVQGWFRVVSILSVLVDLLVCSFMSHPARRFGRFRVMTRLWGALVKKAIVQGYKN